MTPEYLEELGRANNPGPISSLGSHRLSFSKRWGVNGFPVHDSSALAYVIDPTLFETRQAYVDVDYHSPYHAGNTIPTGAASGRWNQTSMSASTSIASASSSSTGNA